MIRPTFSATARVVQAVIGSPAVEAHWEEDSALAGYRISGLIGHTARAALTPLTYLADTEPSGHAIGPAEYFVAMGEADPQRSPEHAAVRERAQAAAAVGPARLAEQVGYAVAQLEEGFGRLAADHRIAVIGQFVMNLDDYLITRIVEMVIHLDDVACSLTEPILDPPDDAVDLTIATVVEISALRHGHYAILRALTRRERVTDYPYAF